MLTVSAVDSTLTVAPESLRRAAPSRLASITAPPAGEPLSEVARFPEGCVRRPSLVSRLIDGRDASLVLITAPAGYGKSTLLADWDESDGRPFIWVTLDARQGNCQAVAGDILRAFQESGLIDPQGLDLPDTSHLSRMAQLLEGLGREGRHFVLVLDEGQAIAPGVLAEVVDTLLPSLGQGAQVALASRSQPPVPIGRLRARRALVELRMQDLKMSPAEAATLLHLAGLDLGFAAVQALFQQTEGWAAGLYLAAVSLLEQGQLSEVESFAGDDHVVSEYFRDEFLDHLAPEAATFLSRTAILDELSGPLCDAVLKREGSALVLDELGKGNAMLVPLDRNGERYRIHALLRATLATELRRNEPRLIPRLHRRTSSWYQRHGDVDLAIDHAFAGDDIHRGGDLLWANLVEYLGQGRNDAVRRWLGRLESEQISDYAPLGLAAAHSCLTTGDLDLAQHWARAAAGAWKRGRAGKATESLATGLAIVSSTAAGVGAAEMRETARDAFEREREGSPWRPICCLLIGTAELLTGNRESARRQLEQGVQLGAVPAPLIASLCLAQLMILAIDERDWDIAADLGDQAYVLLEQPDLAEYPISAIVFAACAATRARQGRADEAKRDLRRGADLLTALGDFIPWYGVQARLLLSRAAIGLADTVAARALLAEASRLGRRARDVVIFQKSFDEAWAQIDDLAATALGGPSSLTIAELRILRFLPSHRSFREIAERLDVSVNTVKTQAHAIYRKLDATSRSDAVARASVAGLLGS